MGDPMPLEVKEVDNERARKFSRTEDYLRSYIYSKRRIERLREQVDEIESSLDSVTTFNGVRIHRSPDPLRREKLLADIADKKKEIQARIDSLELQGLEVLNTISSIKQPAISKALMLYYVQGLTHEQVREHFDPNELPISYWFEGVMLVADMLENGEK